MAKKLDIKKAIKKPGSLTAAAKRKGMTIAQYCKNPPSKKAGYRCRFAKTLKKIAKKRKKKERHAAKGNNPSVVGGRG